MRPQRRPRDIVQSLLIHNHVDKEDRWVGLKLEKESWVNLQATRRGPWGVSDANPRGDGASMRSAWKARVIDFRFKVGISSGPTTVKPILDSILVRHAYTRSQISVEPTQAPLLGPCNYMYSSFFEDWVDPRSILTVICVMHANIGEDQKGAHTHQELRDVGIFFYNHNYVPPTPGQLYGQLEYVPLPNLDNPAWSLPDMITSEAFRAKLHSDFQRVTKATTGSRMGHIQWFVPTHVFIDLFAISNNIRRTPTLLKVNDLEDFLFESIMDPGWDEKIHSGRDIIKCKVIRTSVHFKYHLGRQTLYVNFPYQRLKLLSDGMRWESIDQVVDEQLVWVACKRDGDSVGCFEVGVTWPLTHIRQEIQIGFGSEAMGDDFKFWIQQRGKPPMKVNRRQEKDIVCGSVMEPSILVI